MKSANTMTGKISIRPLLSKAISRRDCLLNHTNARRLVNSLGDHLEGLIIDQYNHHFAIQFLNKKWGGCIQELTDELDKRFGIDYLIIKDRSSSSSAVPGDFKTQVVIGKNSNTTVVENNLKFAVDLNDTLNTGLFLDMRDNRLMVGQMAKSMRVLNCFSYTCSFGVYARAFGAREVINVDVSQKILDKGKINYELNQLPLSSGEFIKTDVREYLRKAVIKQNLFDLIIIDPPSFSRAKGAVFNIQKELPLMIAQVSQILNPHGQMFVSTNNSQITKIGLQQCIKENVKRRIHHMIPRGQDIDFVGSNQSKESHLSAFLIKL